MHKGNAYVFERLAGVWTLTQQLRGSDTDKEDGFGTAIELEGEPDMACSEPGRAESRPDASQRCTRSTRFVVTPSTTVCSPLGQTTVTRSMRDTGPRPKWKRMSLADT